MKAKEKNLSSRAVRKLDGLELTVAQRSLVEKLLVAPMSYMPDVRFRRPSMINPVMAEEVVSVPGQSLTAAEEQNLFLQMNCTKYRLARMRDRLLRQAKWTMDDLLELIRLNKRQLEYRSQIVSANMGLVLAMAKHVSYSGVEFGDLISEGSMALLRASEKFDCSRGWKFSTYACRAIFKGFSRAAKQSYRYRSRFTAQWDPALETDPLGSQGRHDDIEAERASEIQSILKENMAELSGMELSVVKMRFSLGDADSPLTLKEVGRKLGLTKERIRQIQNKALAKLRLVAKERMVMG
jgi:RNA polymerase primary sigma factor